MPKRPCAITITPDNATIICADKFGDVYSLPLLGQTIETSAISTNATESSTGQPDSASQAPSIPSATSLTVHTKGNRQALRQQQLTKKPKVVKKVFGFEHQLVLGHVSLLTDVICAPGSVPYPSRYYILTADRDEHIRVSRGVAQAHIIEGYCLGHNEFVSKLCILPARPQLLLSGGGDDYLLLWNWCSNTIQQRLDLRGHVDSLREHFDNGTVNQMQPLNSEELGTQIESTEDKITIANIIAADIQYQTKVIITCEGYYLNQSSTDLSANVTHRIPALFIFSVLDKDLMSFERYVILEGNVIDVVFIEYGEFFLYSMDTAHAPFSTLTVDVTQDQKSRPSVGSLELINSGWEKDSENHKGLIDGMGKCQGAYPDFPHNSTAKGKSMRELLYNLQSLRKRDVEEWHETK